MLSLNARTLGDYVGMLRRFMREVAPRV